MRNGFSLLQKPLQRLTILPKGVIDFIFFLNLIFQLYTCENVSPCRDSCQQVTLLECDPNLSPALFPGCLLFDQTRRWQRWQMSISSSRLIWLCWRTRHSPSLGWPASWTARWTRSTWYSCTNWSCGVAEDRCCFLLCAVWSPSEAASHTHTHIQCGQGLRGWQRAELRRGH